MKTRKAKLKRQRAHNLLVALSMIKQLDVNPRKFRFHIARNVQLLTPDYDATSQTFSTLFEWDQKSEELRIRAANAKDDEKEAVEKEKAEHEEKKEEMESLRKDYVKHMEEVVQFEIQPCPFIPEFEDESVQDARSRNMRNQQLMDAIEPMLDPTQE